MSVVNLENLGRRKILFLMNFYDAPVPNYYFLLINTTLSFLPPCSTPLQIADVES